MYEETREDILNRMKNNTNDELNKGEGTYIHDNLTPVSIELEKQNIKLDGVLNKVFIEKALRNGYEDEVIARCSEMGIYRKEGKKANGIVTIKGAKDTVIPKDFLIQTKNNIQFKTLEENVVPDTGEIDIKIEAIEVGSKYNVRSNTIIEIPIQIVGITEVTNKNNITNGIDIEPIEDLYKRYKVKVTTPATSGNKYHYYLWAMEIQGVGDCIVKPLWDGNGTVKVILIDSNKKKPNEEIIKNVKEHIEEVRPIGANVTVVGVEEANINIVVNIQIDKSVTLEEVKEEIENNINDYFKTIAFKERIVRYTRIASCILYVKGVIDYENLKINGSTENIKLNDEQVAILESVVVNNA
ncbi:baseplate J/gp47 family protein [Clostridium sporogenes]|uniref:baseplate J/gp47 family protein n=1 Tax=Clostridium sporogenes TaxID=1509 RepID=UPI0013D8436E|nr:baseplate J/gp47 family protein [Clostridium sporogenes]NFQ86818.1 baseplate J/gp47 family protein [Clostridium sporogenes]